MLVRLLPAGERALLVEVAAPEVGRADGEGDGASEIGAVLALDATFRACAAAGAGPWAAVRDVVPAARTVLLHVTEGGRLDALAADVRRLAAGLEPSPGALAAGSPGRPVLEIAVRYDGPDLDEVAHLTGMAAEEVVAAHTGSPWRVAFGGFAPGFAYLVGGDPRLAVPRRGAPRPSVPAGAVGLAGGYSGVYPRASPGGWQLIGTTDAALWDERRDPPALLRPGAVVRFTAAGPERARP
nr:allophanate hydrolase subunit 1 [Phycicoccus duodecadis]